MYHLNACIEGASEVPMLGEAPVREIDRADSTALNLLYGGLQREHVRILGAHVAQR